MFYTWAVSDVPLVHLGVRSGRELQSGNLLEDDSIWEQVMNLVHFKCQWYWGKFLLTFTVCFCQRTHFFFLETIFFTLPRLYKKRTQCWNHEESFTEVYSRRYEDKRSNFRRVQTAVARFSVNKNRETTMVEKYWWGKQWWPNLTRASVKFSIKLWLP